MLYGIFCPQIIHRGKSWTFSGGEKCTMKLSENFTLDEMLKSQTAIRKGIPNLPHDSEVVENLGNLCTTILQKVRNQFGPTAVNSGYRSPELNAAIGGSSKSQHSKGEAADIEVPSVSNYDVAVWIRDNCEFDQLILEGYQSGVPSSGWVHVSLRNGDNRKEVLTATFQGGKAHYQRGLIE